MVILKKRRFRRVSLNSPRPWCSGVTPLDMSERQLGVVEYSPFKNNPLFFSAARSTGAISKACFCCHVFCTSITNRL